MLKQNKGNKMLLVDQFSALTIQEQAETLKAFKVIHAERKAAFKV